MWIIKPQRTSCAHVVLNNMDGAVHSPICVCLPFQRKGPLLLEMCAIQRMGATASMGDVTVAFVQVSGGSSRYICTYYWKSDDLIKAIRESCQECRDTDRTGHCAMTDRSTLLKMSLTRVQRLTEGVASSAHAPNVLWGRHLADV